MTNAHRQHRRPTLLDDTNLWEKTEQELQEGYLEVEITGLTLRRLAVVYAVMIRGAWSYTLDSVRSLLRPTPAL